MSKVLVDGTGVDIGGLGMGLQSVVEWLMGLGKGSW